MAVIVVTTNALDHCVSCGAELAAGPGAAVCYSCRDITRRWPGRPRGMFFVDDFPASIVVVRLTL